MMDLGSYLQILIPTLKKISIAKGNLQRGLGLGHINVAMCQGHLYHCHSVQFEFHPYKEERGSICSKSQLTPDAKQKLREAPFDQKALVEDETFEKAFAIARSIRWDDMLFHPQRFCATIDSHFRGGFRGTPARGRGSHGRGGAKGKLSFFSNDHKSLSNGGPQGGYPKNRGRGKNKRGSRGWGDPKQKPKDE